MLIVIMESNLYARDSVMLLITRATFHPHAIIHNLSSVDTLVPLLHHPYSFSTFFPSCTTAPSPFSATGPSPFSANSIEVSEFAPTAIGSPSFPVRTIFR